MEKIITARHFQLREDAKEAISERLAQINSEYRSLITTRVVLGKERSRFLAEVVMHGNHIDIEAKGKGSDPLHAFEVSLEKADKQLRRHFDKVKDHKHMSISQLEAELEQLGGVEDVDAEEEVFDAV